MKTLNAMKTLKIATIAIALTMSFGTQAEEKNWTEVLYNVQDMFQKACEENILRCSHIRVSGYAKALYAANKPIFGNDWRPYWDPRRSPNSGIDIVSYIKTKKNCQASWNKAMPGIDTIAKVEYIDEDGNTVPIGNIPMIQHLTNSQVNNFNTYCK